MSNSAAGLKAAQAAHRPSTTSNEPITQARLGSRAEALARPVAHATTRALVAFEYYISLSSLSSLAPWPQGRFPPSRAVFLSVYKQARTLVVRVPKIDGSALPWRVLEKRPSHIYVTQEAHMP